MYRSARPIHWIVMYRESIIQVKKLEEIEKNQEK